MFHEGMQTPRNNKSKSACVLVLSSVSWCLDTLMKHSPSLLIYIVLHQSSITPTYTVWILEIFKCSFFAKQLSVHNHREMYIKNDIVVDSQTKHQPNQKKLAICLKWRRIEPAVTSGLIKCKHPCNKNESKMFLNTFTRKFSMIMPYFIFTVYCLLPVWFLGDLREFFASCISLLFDSGNKGSKNCLKHSRLPKQPHRYSSKQHTVKIRDSIFINNFCIQWS